MSLWSKFKNDYPKTYEAAKTAVGMVALAGLIFGLTSLAPAAAVAAPVLQFYQYCSMGAVGISSLFVLGAAAEYKMERDDRSVIETYTNDKGETMEGPRGAIRLIRQNDAEIKESFNAKAEQAMKLEKAQAAVKIVRPVEPKMHAH
jgi:hypothetical protein